MAEPTDVRPVLIVVYPDDTWFTVVGKRAEAQLRAMDRRLLGPAARLLVEAFEKRDNGR